MLGSYGDTVALTPVLDRLARSGVRFTRMFSSLRRLRPEPGRPDHRACTPLDRRQPHADEQRRAGAGLPQLRGGPAARRCGRSPSTSARPATTRRTTPRPTTSSSPRSPPGTRTAARPTGGTGPRGCPSSRSSTSRRPTSRRSGTARTTPWSSRPSACSCPPTTPTPRASAATWPASTATSRSWTARSASCWPSSTRRGVADDTIVIFYSDNGGPLPRGKREILDSGLHVPYLMRFPDGCPRGHGGGRPRGLRGHPGHHPLPGRRAGAGAHAGPPLLGRAEGPAAGVRLRGPRPDGRAGTTTCGRCATAASSTSATTGPTCPTTRTSRTAGRWRPCRSILRLRDEGKLDAVQSLWFRPTEAGRGALRHRGGPPRGARPRPRTPPTGRSWSGCAAALDGWLRARSATGRTARRRSSSRRCGRAACSRRRRRPRSPGATAGWPSSVRPPARRSPTRSTARAFAPATGSSTRSRSRRAPGAVVTATANRVGYAPSPEVRFVVP